MTVRTKIAAIVFAGLTVTMLIWGVVQISALGSDLRSLRIQRLTELAETIRVHYQHFPQGKRISPLDRTLSTLVQLDGRLMSVSIFEMEGDDVDLIAGAGHDYYDWKDANIIKVAKRKRPHYADLETEKGAATGILYPFHKDSATIVISIISLNRAHDDVLSASKRLLLISSLLFVALAMAALLLVYNISVTKPLGVIIKTIDESHQGEKVKQIPIASGDEWGLLARHFNEMARRIGEVMDENEKLTGKLRQKINEATHKILSQQNQISELQRLSTLGHFVATLAHDLGTPLHSIAGITELLLEKPYLSNEQRHKLELILQQARNLVAIIKDVRYATRPPEPHFMLTGVKDLLEETLLFFEPTAQSGDIEVVLSLPENLPEIYIDRNRMQTALFNILQNAREALFQGGKIEITAFRNADGFLVISVKDNGHGIPDDLKDKIIEPFFSTWQEDRIRGLGLAIVEDVVKVHGGTMNIKSNIGEGTEVQMLFPANSRQ